MTTSGTATENLSSMILNFLEFFNEVFWSTSEQSITVIQRRQNKSTEKCFSGMMSKEGDEQKKCGETPGSTDGRH